MLDPRTAVVVHGPAAVFVWCGKRAHAAYAPAAHAWAGRLVKFEGAPAATAVTQGEEPAAFWEALGGGDSEQVRAWCAWCAWCACVRRLCVAQDGRRGAADPTCPRLPPHLGIAGAAPRRMRGLGYISSHTYTHTTHPHELRVQKHPLIQYPSN